VIQTEYDYEPFGATSTTGPSNKNAYKFTAREDDATGLYYYRARYYHPALGRFVSEDPLDSVDEPNLFVYVLNRATGVRDPSGLMGRPPPRVPDIPPGLGNLIGQLPAEVVSELADKSIGGLLGAACAGQYCKAVRTWPKDWPYAPIAFHSAYADCLTLAEKNRIPTGQVGASDSYIAACAEQCIKITKSEKFKQSCRNPKCEDKKK
jgi:RHS repeat-associated protein